MQAPLINAVQLLVKFTAKQHCMHNHAGARIDWQKTLCSTNSKNICDCMFYSVQKNPISPLERLTPSGLQNRAEPLKTSTPASATRPSMARRPFSISACTPPQCTVKRSYMKCDWLCIPNNKINTLRLCGRKTIKKCTHSWSVHGEHGQACQLFVIAVRFAYIRDAICLHTWPSSQ